MIPTDDLVVLLGCACLVSLAFGVLLGVWLCDRRMTKILKGAAEHNLVGSHESTLGRYEDREVQENRRNLADPLNGSAGGGGDRLTGDDREDAKQTGKLSTLNPGDWL